MPLTGASRAFLTAALAHLGAGGIALTLAGPDPPSAPAWDLFLWLLLVGFVGCTTSGLSLHLLPPMARRPIPRGPLPSLAFLATEAGVLLGAYAVATARGAASAGAGLFVGAGLTAAGFALTGALLLRAAGPSRSLPRGPETRPADPPVVPMVLTAWTAAVAAAVLFALSALAPGPGFGWWIAAVHLFVLGHATVLVAAISLRILPRYVGADPPAGLAYLVAALAIAGGVLVPLGFLRALPGASGDLLPYAAPEAAFAVALVALLVLLAARATVPSLRMPLHLTASGLLLVGGGLGLAMLATGRFAAVAAHVAFNALGFLGLTVLAMWFALLAPFQRISHGWTRRMLGGLSTAWLAATFLLAAAGAGVAAGLYPPATVAGAVVVGVAAAGAVGTLPVLYPGLRPLPGLSAEEIRTIRDRWSGR